MIKFFLINIFLITPAISNNFIPLKNLPKFSKQQRLQARLGNILFFEKKLSKNNEISCGTCHNPNLGFSDGLKLAKGSNNIFLKRHTPQLTNVQFQKSFFWDGRAQSLTEQAKQPFLAEDEFDLPLKKAIEKIASNQKFIDAFKKAFPSKGLTEETLIMAIVMFEKTLYSFESPFDQFLKGNKNAISKSAKKGLKLFQGKALCITCHHGIHFTDNDFHNTGVITEDKGRYLIDRVGPKELGPIPYPFFATLKAFKTPTLRNVELSPPYFHNGSEPNLKSVVEFYNIGGKNPDKTGLARGIETLKLTKNEIKDIVNFLKSLTSPLNITPLHINDF